LQPALKFIPGSASDQDTGSRPHTKRTQPNDSSWYRARLGLGAGEPHQHPSIYLEGWCHLPL